MSVEAITWALNDAPHVPPQVVAVLIGLANHARPDGTGAFASQATLAHYARKSDRAVRNDLKLLLQLGLIKVSENQSAAAHIRPDLRPIVYDLTLTTARGSTVPHGSPLPVNATENSYAAGQQAAAAGSRVPGGPVLPPGSPASRGRKHASDKPTTNQKKTSSSSRPRTRARRDDQDPTEPDPNASARMDLARGIVDWWWNQLPIKPAGGSRAYHAAAHAVDSLLAVGHEAAAVAAAARAIGTPLTIARMELQLGKMRTHTQTTPGPHAPHTRRSTTDERVGQALELAAKFAERDGVNLTSLLGLPPRELTP